MTGGQNITKQNDPEFISGQSTPAQ